MILINSLNYVLVLDDGLVSRLYSPFGGLDLPAYQDGSDVSWSSFMGSDGCFPQLEPVLLGLHSSSADDERTIVSPMRRGSFDASSVDSTKPSIIPTSSEEILHSGEQTAAKVPRASSEDSMEDSSSDEDDGSGGSDDEDDVDAESVDQGELKPKGKSRFAC